MRLLPSGIVLYTAVTNVSFQNPPNFVDIQRDQLLEFIEWSGTISTEQVTAKDEEPAVAASKVERSDLDVDSLNIEYNDIRNKFTRGNKRTRAMTGIVTKMVNAMKDQPPTQEQIRSWLTSRDGGRRILGISHLRQYPDAAYYDDLLKIVADPISGFEQYQALLAMEHVARHIDPAQQEQLITAINHQMDYNPDNKQWIEAGSDRSKIAERILKQISAKIS